MTFLKQLVIAILELSFIALENIDKYISKLMRLVKLLSKIYDFIMIISSKEIFELEIHFEKRDKIIKQGLLDTRTYNFTE